MGPEVIPPENVVKKNQTSDGEKKITNNGTYNISSEIINLSKEITQGHANDHFKTKSIKTLNSKK